jgi:hypothetical protein
VNALHPDPDAATFVDVVIPEMGAPQMILEMLKLDAAALEMQHPTFVSTGKYLT